MPKICWCIFEKPFGISGWACKNKRALARHLPATLIDLFLYWFKITDIITKVLAIKIKCIEVVKFPVAWIWVWSLGRDLWSLDSTACVLSVIYGVVLNRDVRVLRDVRDSGVVSSCNFTIFASSQIRAISQQCWT